MQNLFLKYFIALNLLIIPSLSMSFYDIYIIWFFMEISNFMFIIMLSLSSMNKKMIFIYLLAQIISSFMILFSIILNSMFMINNHFFLLLIFSMSMKLNIPPFHLWLPTISIHMPWDMLFIMLTLQKFIPLYFFSLMKINKSLMYMIVTLCAIIPPYMMINLSNLKILFAYSSINHFMWMIMLIYMKNIIWIQYFMFYFFSMISLFFLLYIYKMFFKLNYFNFYSTFMFIPLIFNFNLAGIPPFSLFFMKWFSIFTLMFNNISLIINILMLFSSFFMIYIYINLMNMSLFMFKMNSKLIYFKIYNFYKFIPSLLFLSMFMSLIIIII